MNSRPTKASMSRLPLILLALAALAAGAMIFFRPAPAPQGNLTGAAVGGPFTLVDEAGRSVTSDSFKGQWRLMYFGFTYCPDVCPVDAAKLGQGFAAFEKANPAAAKKVQPLFVTVDPERDTPAALAEFTNAFHPRLVGLTGSRAQIDDMLKRFRIYASKVPGVTEGSYTYDHLAVFYLMDPEGRPVAFQAASTVTPEAVTEMLEKYVT
jgi:protein SCO1/2